MQYNILWIFVVAAFGVCHCDDSTDDDSTDDSSFSSEESRCSGPPFNPRGFMQQKGWFYDKNRDECRVYYFGTNDWDDTKNKFQTVEQCRKTCRSGVPIYCFMKPNEGKRRESLPMFTYNSKNGLCVHVDITVSTDTHGTNVFRSDKKCNITCRDPELGKCAPSALNDCSRQESDTSYRFDVDSQTCREVEKGKCGPFTSLEGCSQRCGRYIPKKCHMPAVTSKYCDINETRYLYNSLTEKCEAVAGCADDNTNFRTARDCWMTCSSEQSSRCMKRPDLGRAGFGKTRFYYNITDNTCGKTTYIAFWQDTSKKNNFKSLQECMEMCKLGECCRGSSVTQPQLDHKLAHHMPELRACWGQFTNTVQDIRLRTKVMSRKYKTRNLIAVCALTTEAFSTLIQKTNNKIEDSAS